MIAETAFSESAERGVIGAMFLAPQRFAGLAAVLTSGEFFLPPNVAIWEAMEDVHRSRRQPEITVVADHMRAAGTLGKLKEGEMYLSECMNGAPLPEQIADRVAVVKRNAAVRALRAACASVASMCDGDPEHAAETLRRASRLILDVTVGRSAAGEGLDVTAEQLLADMEAAHRGEIAARIPTGIVRLDRVLGGGLAPEHLVVPMGLTSSGKSSFGIQVVFRGAKERQIPALLFTLEMSRAEVAIKGGCSIERVDTDVFKVPEAGALVDWKAAQRASFAAGKLAGLIRVSESREIGRILAEAAQWRAQTPGPAIILVDHIQKIRGVRTKTGNRQEEVAGVVSALKDMAKDLKVPVIAPAQLDNDAQKEKRAPRLGDERECKAIAHEADVVLGIHRPDREAERCECELSVLKHRGGRVGKVTVQWVGAWQGLEPPDVRDHHDDESEAA